MKKFLALLLGTVMVFGVLAATGCSSETAGYGNVNVPLEYYEYKAPAEGEEEKEYNRETVYQNDLEELGADPSVIYIEEGDQAGYFYMYVTSDQIGASGYQAFRSKDLNQWECMGVAYNPVNFYDEEGYTFTSFATTNFWAPEVIYDEDLGLYMMFYNAAYLFRGLDFYIDCAVSENPQGPFEQYAIYIQGVEASADATQEEKDLLAYWQEKLAPVEDNEAAKSAGFAEGSLYVYPALVDFRDMREQKEGEDDGDYLTKEAGDGYMKVIDASPFIDPQTGDKYLYFVRDLGSGHSTSSICVMQMDEYWRPLLDENENYANVRLLTETNKLTLEGQEEALNEGRVNEAPFVIYNESNQKYYLMLSVNTFTDKMYSVRLAVSDSPNGPFTKLTREQGGWLLYADPSCSWMSGTGHNSVVEKDGKMFIVYHAHTDRVTGNSSRAIAFDSLVWVTNSDNEQVLHANGGSYAYMPQTTGEWSNIAPEATVTASNVKDGSDVKYLNDGAVMIHDDGVVSEFVMNAGTAEITLKFSEYREICALFIYNSSNYDLAFNRIESVEFSFKDDDAKVAGTAYTSNLDFYWDKYYTSDGEYIPGGSFIIEFAPMLVNEITIKIPGVSTEHAISDIAVLGK